jgi:hypothetical protein
MKAKILNLQEALQMYDLIGEYLPKETTTQIEAIHAMVTHMGQYKYFKCLELLTGESKEVLVNAEQNDRLSAFLVGFQENRLFELPRLKQDGLHD